MTSLASIEAEASKLVGRLPESRRRPLQEALVELCATHWQELRGAEPATPLAQGLWATVPPLADLCANLYAQHDERLYRILQRRDPAQAFALLALAAIEHADAEGARLAYEPMMLLDTPAAGDIHAQRVAALLHGELNLPRLRRHTSTPPLEKALRLITTHTGRYDLHAVMLILGLLAGPPQPDPDLAQIRLALEEAGIRFTAVDGRRVHFALHGEPRPPATLHRLSEVLEALRRERLA